MIDAIRIKDNIIWKLVENELVIVKTDTDEYMYLNPTGADIFEMISKGMMSDEIKRELILPVRRPRRDDKFGF